MSQISTFDPDMVILTLVEKSGEQGIAGRTRIQKAVYFLKYQYGLNIPADYTPYYYGPYSDEITLTVGSLVARGLLEEKVEALPSGGLFEGRLFRYKLTPDGRTILRNLEKTLGTQAMKIRESLDNLLVNNPNTTTLAVASKLHYILQKSQKPVRKEEVSSLAKGFGWRVKEREVDSAVGFLLMQGYVAAK